MKRSRALPAVAVLCLALAACGATNEGPRSSTTPDNSSPRPPTTSAPHTSPAVREMTQEEYAKLLDRAATASYRVSAVILGTPYEGSVAGRGSDQPADYSITKTGPMVTVQARRIGDTFYERLSAGGPQEDARYTKETIQGRSGDSGIGEHVEAPLVINELVKDPATVIFTEATETIDNVQCEEYRGQLHDVSTDTLFTLSLWVGDDGYPYRLSVTRKDGKESEYEQIWNFSKWNAPVDIQAPAPGEIRS